MKKLLFAVTALAALSLLAPSTGFAQFNNHMGIYTDEMAVNADVAPYSQTEVYLVVTNPYNEAEGWDVNWVHGYECHVTVTGPAVFLTLAWPVDALNVGDNTTQVVAYGTTDVQVVDGAAVLATMTFLYTGTTEGVTLHLAPRPENASVPDMMAVLDGESVTDQLVACYSSAGAGNWEGAVFGFNADPGVVATDQSSFDNIKAMYR